MDGVADFRFGEYLRSDEGLGMFGEHRSSGLEDLLVLDYGLDLLGNFCHLGFSTCLKPINQVLGLGVKWITVLVLCS